MRSHLVPSLRLWLYRMRPLAVLGFLLFALPLVAADTSGGNWIALFDGKSLAGWKASENPASFTVQDGAMVAHGPRAHLFYVGDVQGADFRNFEFAAEVKAAPGANSGIYFHSAFQETGFPGKGFEVQVNNSATLHNGYLERKKTGSLYGLRNVYKQLVPDDQWFGLRITVRGPRVEIWVNDLLVVDYVEPEAAVAPTNRPGRRLGHGTFALQGHDPESRVSFRNLRVKPLPDDVSPGPVTRPVADEVYRQVLQLGSANFPLVDFHTHLKGGLTLEQVLAHTRQTGLGHGLAVNCGVGFAVTNDAGIVDFLKSMAGAPVFVGMQAEGREWTKLFSPQAIARFDYVFTDAMTIVDHRGQRARLWMPAEVDIPDKQAFMERLVETIVGILEREPVDIYVNPTYLPEVIAGEYDTLWTPERQQRVIAAAAKNGVAIEINSRLKLPKAGFIRAAKQAGLKFTLGTNNTDADLGRNEYGLAMIRECKLAWQDFWMPKPDGQKPIQVRGK
jgi:hypothetical protein